MSKDYEREYKRRLKELQLEHINNMIDALTWRSIATTNPLKMIKYDEMIRLLELKKKKLEMELEQEKG